MILIQRIVIRIRSNDRPVDPRSRSKSHRNNGKHKKQGNGCLSNTGNARTHAWAEKEVGDSFPYRPSLCPFLSQETNLQLYNPWSSPYVHVRGINQLKQCSAQQREHNDDTRDDHGSDIHGSEGGSSALLASASCSGTSRCCSSDGSRARGGSSS